MKHQILLPCLLFSIFLAGAAELPIIYSEDTENKIAVAETGKFLAADAPGTRNNQGAPRSTMAGRLAVNNKEFYWTPSQQTHRATGGADLTSVHLSGDKTILMFVERVGGEGKPNSTRLVFLSLRNRKIIHGLTLKQKSLSCVSFIPGKCQILAVQNAQPDLNQPCRLLNIDLSSGKILAQSQPVNDKILSAVCNQKKFWYTVEGKSFIYENTLQNLSRPPAALKTAVENPRLSLAPNGENLIVFGQKQVDFFKISNFQNTYWGASIALESSFAPTEALALSDDGTQVLLIEPERQAFLCRNGIAEALPEKPAGFQAFFKKDNILLFGLLKHNAIARLNLPDTEAQGRPIVPGNLKPLSRNITWKMLAFTDSPVKALLVDNRANVTLIEITKRRWKKYPVFTADRTGQRK